MNLTEKEKTIFNRIKSEDEFYVQYKKVREARNGYLPSYLVREVLVIYNKLFPKDHSDD